MSSYRARAADFGGFLDYNTGKVGYIIGSRGEICTNTLVTERINDTRYAKYAANLKSYGYRWVGKVVADCAGYYEMFLSGGSWQKPLVAWKYPDTTANTLYTLAKQFGLPHGPMDTLPIDCPYPLAVGYPGHVGFYYHRKVYQNAGHKVGTMKTELNDTTHNKAWQYWYVIPWLDYEGWVPGDNQKGEEDGHMIDILGSGPELAIIQQTLIDVGFKGDMNPERLGTGGPRTKAALIAFQKHYGFPETGVVDEATQAGLLRAIKGQSVDPGTVKALTDQISLLANKITAAKAALS